MTKPKGKAVSVSVSETPETPEWTHSEQIAMVMEDGSVWVKQRCLSVDGAWTEWECIYAPEPA